MDKTSPSSGDFRNMDGPTLVEVGAISRNDGNSAEWGINLEVLQVIPGLSRPVER